MKQLPNKSGEFLFEIIMRRYELKSTMMTSNRPVEDWGNRSRVSRKVSHRGTGNAETLNVPIFPSASSVPL